MSKELKMRYTVGQVVLFLHIVFIPKELRMGGLYFPWADEFVGVKFKKLLCKEHHRVPGDWDDEIKYDGFIFSETVDGKEEIYHNQYPRASYGQLDDSGNWKIIDHTTDDFHFYQDAEKALETILRGVKELKEREPEWSKSLQEHFDQMVKLINEQGFDVKVGPVVFNKLDGTTESFPDILGVKLTQKEEVTA